jgi:hypothetical protein
MDANESGVDEPMIIDLWPKGRFVVTTDTGEKIAVRMSDDQAKSVYQQLHARYQPKVRSIFGRKGILD